MDEHRNKQFSSTRVQERHIKRYASEIILESRGRKYKNDIEFNDMCTTIVWPLVHYINIYCIVKM